MPDGYNGFQLHYAFLDTVNTNYFCEMARPMLHELVSAEANVLQIDCSFQFAKQVKMEAQIGNDKIYEFQPYEAIITITNELNQIVWVEWICTRETFARGLSRALQNSDDSRHKIFGSVSAPKVIYTDNCCLVRKLGVSGLTLRSSSIFLIGLIASRILECSFKPSIAQKLL